jgi:MerR family copper efflux transcriptional regulator
MRAARKTTRTERAPEERVRQHNIGAAARLTGVSAKMIRHYEAIGLLPHVDRTSSGYRLYGDADLHRLRFIRRARSLGFSIRDIGTLLGLWDDPRRASRDVKRLAQAQIDELERRISEMQSMQRALRELARRCHGDTRPECPVLDDLASE